MAVIPLTCPMCGALIDLDESKEFGLCSFCGAKVMREKIIVEHQGNISLNTTEETKNLYVIARRALADEDYSNAANYYNTILTRNPNDWEASFYLSYCEAYSCKLGEIGLVTNKLSNRLESTFNLLKGSPNSATQVNVVTKLYNDIEKLTSTFLISGLSLKTTYNEGTYNANVHALEELYFHFGDLIETNFNQQAPLRKTMLDCWKKAIDIEANYIVHATEEHRKNLCKSSILGKIEKYESKIQIYEPSYIAYQRKTEEELKQEEKADTILGCTGAIIGLIVLAAIVGFIVWKVLFYADLFDF